MPKDMDPDLMLVLGKPEGKSKSKGKGYLDGKPQELRSYLEKAVDTDATADERAEALCRAIEFSKNSAEVEDAAEPEADSGY